MCERERARERGELKWSCCCLKLRLQSGHGGVAGAVTLMLQRKTKKFK